MKILLVGSGGREHALAWKLSASPLLTRLWCAPGNAGIAAVAECVPIAVEDLDDLVAFAREHAVDFVVVGPEASLRQRSPRCGSRGKLVIAVGMRS